MTKMESLNRFRKKKMKKSNVFTANEDRIRIFRKWYANGGRDQLDEAMEQAQKDCDYYKKAREPDWSRIQK